MHLLYIKISISLHISMLLLLYSMPPCSAGFGLKATAIWWFISSSSNVRIQNYCPSSPTALESQIFPILDVDCGRYIVSIEKNRRSWPSINTLSCKFFLSSVFQNIEKSKCHSGAYPCSSLYWGTDTRMQRNPERQVGTSSVFWEAHGHKYGSVCYGVDMSPMCPCVKGLIRRCWENLWNVKPSGGI